mgnify:FL=1
MKEYKVEGHVSSYLPEDREWRLIWNDEFDGKELDTSKWDYRLNFWGKPFDGYTDKGVVLDGNSHIELHRVERNGCYVSPQLQTGSNSFDIPKGKQDSPWKQDDIWPLGTLPEPKFMHRYGYYEVRCKFQKFPKSMWSAFWLQSPSIGTTYDPSWSGVECDIMEHFQEGRASCGTISGGYGEQFKEEGRVHFDLENTKDGFHTFGLYWSPEKYIFYCDGKKVSEAEEAVSQIPQFVLLTTEVKGYRDGKPLKIGEEVVESEAILDGKREVVSEGYVDDAFIADYVRVFDTDF